jgi:hypothetical protein
MNQTPLMAAAAAGNVPLVEALLARGADREAVDHYGYNALHWALREAFRDCEIRPRPTRRALRATGPGQHRRQYRRTTGAHRPAPVRIFPLPDAVGPLQVALHPPPAASQRRLRRAGPLDAWQDLPANIVRPERNKRQHLSSVLARNEIDRDYAYNRALFMRFTRAGISSIPSSRCVAAVATTSSGCRFMRRSTCR